MIPNHAPHEVIIISDDSLLNALKSSNNDDLEAAQVIIDYLSTKKENKSAVMIPKVYRELLEKINTTKNRELLRYFESFFCEARIGFSDKNHNSVEYKTVIEYLSYSHNSIIFFITTDSECISMAKNIGNTNLLYGDVQEIKRYIFSYDKDFYEKIFRQYYDSSSI